MSNNGACPDSMTRETSRTYESEEKQKLSQSVETHSPLPPHQSLLDPLSIAGDELRGNTTKAEEHSKENGKRKRHNWQIGLFSVTTFLLFADQNLMAPNLTAIAKDFGFSDIERDRKLGGDISFAFFLLAAPASILVGCLADSKSFTRCNIRTKLFALVVGIGEGACFLTFFSKTYTQLYFCRAVTGFSIGGSLPLLYSILGDLFAADERYVVNSIVQIGIGTGIGAGQALAGFLGPTYGWRSPFLVVSIPALLCALLVSAFVQDPERGAMEETRLQQQNQQQQLDDDFFSNGQSQLQIPSSRSQPQKDDVDADTETDGLEMTRFNVPPKTNQTDDHSLRSRGGFVSTRVVCREDNRNEIVDEYKYESLEKSNSSLPNKCEQYGLSIPLLVPWLAPHLTTVIFILSTPTAVLSIIQGAPGCLPWGIILVYLNDFLAEDRGMSVEHATFVLLCFSVGVFVGVTIGGAGGRYLYRIDKRYPALLAGLSAIIGCFPFWMLLNGVHANSPIWYASTIAFGTGIGCAITGPIIQATLQNVTLPHARGQAFAIFNTFNDVGKGFGPVILSIMIAHLGGRTHAFNIGTLGWVLCGILILATFFTIESDEQRVQAALAMDLAATEQRTIPTERERKYSDV